MDRQGETVRYGGARSVASLAKEWQDREPALRLFMDGSRRTYKIADIPIGAQVFPVIAGQVGVGVCKRENRCMAACELTIHTVLSFPDKLDTEGKNEIQNWEVLLGLAPRPIEPHRRVHFELDS
jgi:hypothetical protein